MSSELQDIRLSSALAPDTIDAMARHFSRPHPDYPGHLDWADKSLVEFQLGIKTPAVVWYGSEPLGFGACQRSPVDSTVLEINHMYVDPRVTGQHVGSILFRRLQLAGADNYPGVMVASGNTKRTQTGLIKFLIGEGCHVLPARIIASNYGHNGVEDVTLVKPLSVSARSQA